MIKQHLIKLLIEAGYNVTEPNTNILVVNHKLVWLANDHLKLIRRTSYIGTPDTNLHYSDPDFQQKLEKIIQEIR